ncbi:MAG: hypothetical protein JNK56_03150 [Myxococcales bacterium]|nr:hypothetical protein [Myxococcales bacterium]
MGDFSSIVCFKALVVGVEDTLGAQASNVALKAAGRMRGKALATSLGFGAKATPLADALVALRTALGKDGTRLCYVESITQEGEDYLVSLSETVCSAGEPQGSDRQLTFTLGAVHGALEVLTQARFRGKQVGSVLRGDAYDVIRFAPM